jgi:hypothetical protein
MINKDRLQMYVSLTKITIVLCWLSLFSFWAIKIFGGNWFEIMVENENFVRFSNTVQNTWLKYLVSFITVFTARFLTIGAICQKFVFKGKQLLIVMFSLISMWAVSNFVPMEILSLPVWYGYILLITIPIIFQKGWKKSFGVFAVILDFAFSSISMITRNVKLALVDDYLLLLILVIDMYIMFALYYLYSNLIRLKKEIR